MDFNKLSKVSDDLLTGRKQVATAKGLELSQEESPLDSLETRVPIRDSKPTKVVILDDVRISQIMHMERTQRRKILSRLSDSERHRVFARYRKIKDAELSKLELVNLNSLLTNVAFSNDSYSKNLLIEFLNENGNKNISFDIKALADRFIDDKFSAETDGELIEKVVAEFESKGIETSLGDVTNMVYDSTELSPEIIEAINKAGESYRQKIEEGKLSFDEMMEEYDTIVSSFTTKGIPYDKVEEILIQAANNAMKSVYDSLNTLKKSSIRDAVIDKIAELELRDEDGEPIRTQEEEEISPLQELNNALTEFLQGNLEPLQALASTSEGTPEQEPTGDKVEEDLESEELSEEFPNDPSEGEVQFSDCAKFAKSILKRGKNMSMIADRFIPHTNLAKAFRISDCEIESCPYELPSETVAEVPMTRPEFYAAYQPPPIPEMVKEMNPTVGGMPVYSYKMNEGYIVTNPDVVPQKWVPVKLTIGQIIEDLENISCPIVRMQYILNNCVTVDDCVNFAANYGFLPTISNLFYKKKMSDSHWTFDKMPKCVKTSSVGNWTKVYDSRNPQPEGSVECTIYGKKYFLL